MLFGMAWVARLRDSTPSRADLRRNSLECFEEATETRDAGVCIFVMHALKRGRMAKRDDDVKVLLWLWGMWRSKRHRCRCILMH